MHYCALEPLKTWHTIMCKIVYTSMIMRLPDPLLVPVSYYFTEKYHIKGTCFEHFTELQEYQPYCNMVKKAQNSHLRLTGDYGLISYIL